MMTYKGYTGAIVSVDAEENEIVGRVIGLRDVITFVATTPRDLQREFEASVDEYLGFCKEHGEKPEKPVSGKFVVRVPPELHRRAANCAAAQKASLNDLVKEAMEAYLDREEREATFV